MHKILIIFCLCLAACHQPPTNPNALALQARIAPDLQAIGFAYVYAADIQAVSIGKLDKKSIAITILPNEQADISRFFEQAREQQRTVFLQFERHQTNETNRYAFVNGFVDDQQTSWRIVEYSFINN